MNDDILFLPSLSDDQPDEIEPEIDAAGDYVEEPVIVLVSHPVSIVMMRSTLIHIVPSRAFRTFPIKLRVVQYTRPDTIFPDIPTIR